ncbi:MAG: phosphatidylinositol mannoside acyltransferase [Micromonosporaceae bacterium]|nr:phosphatidylinositol mannoside acyltransferase [Micromonosporaceae bacterium]
MAYGAGWSIVKATPRSLAWPVFRAAADRAARRNGPGTQRLRRNLRQVVGPDMSDAELDELVRAGLRSYARYWLDAFQLPRYSREDFLTMFAIENGERIGEAVEAGTGCVIALPHSGNWDTAGAWVCANGWPLTTVAERLKPEGVYQKFVAYRESLGMEIIPTVGGERAPLEILTERLGQGHVVPLLADRDLSTRGVEVRFFGGRTRMPAGPAMLALRTGAPLFVASLWYDEDYNARGRLDGPLPIPEDGPLDVRVRALTQQIADLLARGIAEHPRDWHMLQRLWLSDQATSAQSTPEQTAPDQARAATSSVDAVSMDSSSVDASPVDASPVAAADPVSQESG